MHLHIRAARAQKGLTQKQLAELVGINPSTFNGYEKGNHDPKSNLLIKIADACDVSLDFLLGRNTVDKSIVLIDSESSLLNSYRELNAEGQEKLLEYADDLQSLGKYKKHSEFIMGSKEA